MSYKHVLFWVYLSEVWQVLTSCYLRHQRWFFFSMFEMVQMQILFQFLQGWRLQHNWNMRNAFMFDGRHGVKAYANKLKCVHSHVESLDIRACGDHFFMCILRISK